MGNVNIPQKFERGHLNKSIDYVAIALVCFAGLFLVSFRVATSFLENDPAPLTFGVWIWFVLLSCGFINFALRAIIVAIPQPVVEEKES